MAKISQKSQEPDQDSRSEKSLDYNFIALDSNLRNKIKMQQVNTRAEMATSSQQSTMGAAPRGKPPIQPVLVQSMSLRDAFGAGHSSSSTKEENQLRSQIKPKQNLVISGRRQLTGNSTQNVTQQQSAERLLMSSRLSITHSTTALPCATPQPVHERQSQIARAATNNSAVAVSEDLAVNGIRSDMAHRAQLIGKLISMEQNSMSKLLMVETGYEKAHMSTLQTPNGSEGLMLSCNSTRKVSPAKKRNPIAQHTDQPLSQSQQSQQSSQVARKSKRVQVRSSFKPTSGGTSSQNTMSANVQAKFPSNRTIKAPSPNQWSSQKSNKYKSRASIERNNNSNQGQLSSVRSNQSNKQLTQQPTMQQVKQQPSAACPQFDVNGSQIRPVTVPGQQQIHFQRPQNNNSSQKAELKIDQMAPMANISGSSHRYSHQKQISITSARKRAEQLESQNGGNNNFLLREATAENQQQQHQQQDQFQTIKLVNSTLLDHQQLLKANTLKPRAPTEIFEAQHNQTTMLHIQQQVQHPRQKSTSNQSLHQVANSKSNNASSGFELSSFIKPVHVKQEEFFMLDNQNRVILVSMNPNAAAQPPQQKVNGSGGNNVTKPKSIKRQGNSSFTNENNFTSQSVNSALHATLQQHTQQPLIGNQQVSCSGQQKIVDQLSGKHNTKRKVSMANHQALKENSESFSRQESAHLRASELVEQKQTSSSHHSGFTRNDTIGQKANRNSNQSIKMTGQGVSRFGSTATNFSATTSNYNSVIPASQTITLSAPPKGYVYQLDQNGNYVMAPTQLAGAPVMSAQLRQMQMMQPGQRPQANQVYFSNLHLQQQAHAAHLHKMQGGHQHQATLLQYQSNQTSSQQSIQHSQGSTRPRPRSSAPTASATVGVSSGIKRSAHGGQGSVAGQDLGLRVQHANSGQQVIDLSGGEEGLSQQHRLTSENLIQTAGHIIVSNNSNGTPHNELQMPMIINQTSQQRSFMSHPGATAGQGSLQMMNVTHALDHPQLILQQVSNRREGSASATQNNGFFVKRNKRDSKTGFHQLQQQQQQIPSQQTTPQTTSNSSKVTINNQQGANGQSFFLHESITSSQHRPSTGSHHHGQSFNHKHSANVASKLNANSRVSNQPTTALGESDSENTATNRATGSDSIALSGLTLTGNRSSVQGQQQLQLQHQQQLQNQKNLQSVRSGQLMNYSSSICAEPDANTSSKDQLMPHKQNSLSEKPKNLNSSASPSTKITIRGRKGMSSIIGNGVTAQGVAGPGLQMLPSTPKTYKRTKRVLFARRMNLMDRPVLVITFQGVIGDFMKKQAVQGLKEVQIQSVPSAKTEKKKVEQQKEEEMVYVRAGVAEGLKYLSSLFQLIIFSRETVEDTWFQSKGGQQPQSGVQTTAILNWLQSNPDIKLDGFYASTVIAKQQTMTDDYSQIFMDFGLNSEQKITEKVLFVNSIESEFFCNQRLPACANLSPRGKKPTAAQLGITNARGLTDVDPYGYFMFDTSCQPALPLVKGVPISIDSKHQKQTSRLRGTRSSSLIIDQQQQDDTASCGGTEPDQLKTLQMPTTLLVPNLRTQHAKLQTNFQHVIKTIMMLAFLGQKKSAGKHLIKESSARDLASDLSEIETMFGAIKEKQVRLTKQVLHISQAQQLSRGMTETANGTASAGFQNNLNKSQKAASLQRRIRQAQGSSVGCSAAGMGAPVRDTESPTSDMSGRNGSRGRRLKHQGSGKNQLGFKPATMTSSRTAATTHMANEITGSSSHSNPQQKPAIISVHQLRSSSINSEKGNALVAEPNTQLFTNESQTQVGLHENSPRVMGHNEIGLAQKELSIDLSDGAFFSNLSWSVGVDYLSQRPLGHQKRFLGMQALCSDIVWRFYKRQAEERIKLRQLYEARMQASEELVTNTLTNETIVNNQQKSIEQIYEILRSRDLVGNPFGFTMGRNYRFFANLKFQLRRKLSRELETWKARNEAAAAIQKPKGEQTTVTAPMATTQASERAMLAAGKGFDLQVLQQQQHEAIEELLEKNKLMNRFVVVGLDAPAMK